LDGHFNKSILQASREEVDEDREGEKEVCSLNQIVLYACEPGKESVGMMLPSLCQTIVDGERDVETMFERTCAQAAGCVVYNKLMGDVTL
jgi:hypothetical protein